MFKGKQVVVALVDEAKETYLELKRIVAEEQERGLSGTRHQSVLASIDRAILQLKADPQHGTHIRKKQIPSIYRERYGVTNLWKCDLASFWRLIYWIDGTDEVKIVSFVLDIIDHDLYDKRFGYRKN